MSVRPDSEKRSNDWLLKNRPWRDVYPGGCGTRIGPQKWKHKVDLRRRINRVTHHPTTEMALAACAKPDTSAEVLKVLGNWDEHDYPEVRRAARAHLNYPAP